MKRISLIGVLLVTVLVLRSQGADAPAQPASRPGPVQLVQRLCTAIGTLDLTDDQKPQIQTLLDQVQKQASDLADQLAGLSPQDKADKIAEFRQDVIQQLQDILTPEQMKALGQKMSQGRRGEIEVLRQSLGKLDLSADQQKQVKDLLDQTEQTTKDLRQKAAGGMDVSADVQDLRESVRTKLQDILTPDQQDKLKELMQAARDDANKDNDAGGGNGAGKDGAKDGGKGDQPANDTTKPTAMAKPADVPVPVRVAGPTTRPTSDHLLAIAGPEVGSVAPDVQMLMSNGQPLQISSYKGHVLVLEFGSWSCPTFREKVAGMEQLKADVGSNASFVLVYTREAHASNERVIERNTHDRIQIPQPATLEARRAVAERAAAALGITLPMVVDSMDDQAVKAFGGFPNGCVVIGKDGTISARQRWVDPVVLRGEIDQANQ